MLKLPEIGHIGYLVEDVDRAAADFSASCDYPAFVVYDFVPKRAWSYGTEIFDCKFRIGICSPEQGAKIELIQFISGTNTPHEAFLKEHGPGIHHIAYYATEEYDALREHFAALPGGRIIFEAEIEDEVMGKRCSFYAEAPGYPSIIEVSKRPTKLK